MKKLVGRNAELAIILSGLLDGNSSIVVTGAPGSGKSALAEAVAQQVHKVLPKPAKMRVLIDADNAQLLEVLKLSETDPDGSVLIADCGRNITSLSANVIDAILTRMGGGKQRIFLTMTNIPPEFLAPIEQQKLVSLPLPNLSATEAEELLLQESGRTLIDVDTRDRILLATRNQPKLLLGVLAALVQLALADESVTLNWDDEAVVAAPAVQELVTETLAQASNGEHHFLESLALAGTIESAVVHALMRHFVGQEHADTTLTRLLESVLINVKDELGVQRISFREPLLQLALKTGIDLIQARKYYGELFRIVLPHLAQGQHHPNRTQAIIWGKNAGEQVPWGWLKDVVESRQLVDNYVTDIEICTAIIAHPEAESRDRAIGYMLRAERLRFTDHASTALEDLSRALQQFHPQPGKEDIELIVEIAFIAADIEQYAFDRTQDSLDRLDSVEALIAPLGVKKAMRKLHVGKATRVAYAGDFSQAITLIRQATKAYPMADLLPLASAKILIWGQRGKHREAIKFGNRALLSALLQGKNGARRSAEIVAAIYLSSLLSGDIVEANKLDQRVELARRSTAFAGQYDGGLLELGAGLSLVHQGLWTEARQVLDTAMLRLREHDPSGFLPLALAAATVAAAACGDRQKVQEHQQEIDITPPRSSRILEGVIRGYIVQALHWVQDEHAGQEAQKLANWAQKRALPLVQLKAEHVHMMVQKKFLKTEAEDIQVLANEINSPLGESLAAHAQEMAQEKSPVLFGKSARMLARLGYWVPTQLELPELTDREIEIAKMAGLGFSSRVIAQKFTISKRTVDTHLSNIFSKLGLNQREDIADILERIS